jgi:hypothetical protein
MRTGLAALAVLAAIPATAGAVSAQSTITIFNEAPAGAPAVTFHLTGPTCAGVPTNFEFALANGESKTFVLCDANPLPVSGRFMAVEDVPAGWKLTGITCDNDDLDPADALIIDLPAATAKIELSELNEFKSCTFHNVPPTSPPALTPVAPTQVPASAPPLPPVPAQSVGGVQQKSPARVARIEAATVCASRIARVTVRGQSMRDVTLFLNGRRIKTIKVGAATRTVRTSVPIARGNNRRQVVTARVRFRNGARARTIKANARRCAAAQVQPQFTG